MLNRDEHSSLFSRSIREKNNKSYGVKESLHLTNKLKNRIYVRKYLCVGLYACGCLGLYVQVSLYVCAYQRIYTYICNVLTHIYIHISKFMSLYVCMYNVGEGESVCV